MMGIQYSKYYATIYTSILLKKVLKYWYCIVPCPSASGYNKYVPSRRTHIFVNAYKMEADEYR